MIWLYDHFDRLLLPGGEKLYEEHQQKLHQRWLQRRKLLYAHQQSLKAQKAEAEQEQQQQKKVRLEEQAESDEKATAMLVDDASKINAGDEGEATSTVPNDEQATEDDALGEWLELPPLPSFTYV